MVFSAVPLLSLHPIKHTIKSKLIPVLINTFCIFHPLFVSITASQMHSLSQSIGDSRWPSIFSLGNFAITVYSGYIKISCKKTLI